MTMVTAEVGVAGCDSGGPETVVVAVVVAVVAGFVGGDTVHPEIVAAVSADAAVTVVVVVVVVVVAVGVGVVVWQVVAAV